MPNSVLTAGNTKGIALRFEAGLQSDRFHTNISLVTNHEVRRILSSQEGNGQQPWPPSPPLQECLVHELNERNVILATGMAGKTHWSVSVEAGDNPTKLTWDVACRTGSSDFDLMSSYSLHDLVNPEIRETDLHITRDGINLRLSSVKVDGCAGLIELDKNRLLTIRPNPGSPALPCTFRWKYELCVVSPQV